MSESHDEEREEEEEEKSAAKQRCPSAWGRQSGDLDQLNEMRLDSARDHLISADVALADVRIEVSYLPPFVTVLLFIGWYLG